MLTRKQYMSSEVTHQQYYEQFSTEALREFVKQRFPVQELKAAYIEGKHLNSIPLQLWDNMAIVTRQAVEEKLRDAGDFWSLAGGVCILKAIARQIIEQEGKQPHE